MCVSVCGNSVYSYVYALFCLVTRDTMIAQMKRTIAEQKDTIEELRQQKMKYMVQLYDANKKIADLENKLVILSFTTMFISIHFCL